MSKLVDYTRRVVRTIDKRTACNFTWNKDNTFELKETDSTKDTDIPKEGRDESGGGGERERQTLGGGR